MDNKTLYNLKEKYWNIYTSEILDYNFIWRELSRGEYNKVLRYFHDEYEREEEICKLCLIEPKEFDFNECEAGVSTLLAIQIAQESGFSSTPTGKIDLILTQYRNDMQNFQNQVSCIIHEAFPTLDIEKIENWPLEKTLWYFSRAEYKLSLRGIVLENSSQETTAPTAPTAMAHPMPSNLPGAQTSFDVTSGDAGDFPELRAQKAFMKGKMKF